MLSAPLGVDPRSIHGLPNGKIPRRYIVRMRRSVHDLDAAIDNVLLTTRVSTASAAAASDGSFVSTASLAAVGAKPHTKYSGGGMKGFVLELPKDLDEGDAVAKLAAQSDVLRVVPDTWVGIAGATARLSAGAEVTTSLMRVGAVQAPTGVRARASRLPLVQEKSSGEVVVGLIDTGCDVTNTELNIVGGVDFTSDNSYGLDANGHGTHVAGIMGSKGEGKGIVGMYPGVSIFCLKVLGASGQGTMGTVVTALTWLAANGREKKIRVVNLSLSGEPNSEVCDAISAVTRQGITVVVAAGNNGGDTAKFSPGNCADALVVTAVSDFDGLAGGRRGRDAESGEVDDTPASFSNWAGGAADEQPGNMIAAPGVRILSFLPAYRCLDASSGCIPGTPNLAYLSGTSMATPMITAQVAMCYEQGVCKADNAPEGGRVVRASASYNRANRGFGYRGDPASRTPGGRFYGYLMYGNAF